MGVLVGDLAATTATGAPLYLPTTTTSTTNSTTTTSRGGPPLPKTKFKNDREWRGGALWQECRAAVAFL